MKKKKKNDGKNANIYLEGGRQAGRQAGKENTYLEI